MVFLLRGLKLWRKRLRWRRRLEAFFADLLSRDTPFSWSVGHPEACNISTSNFRFWGRPFSKKLFLIKKRICVLCSIKFGLHLLVEVNFSQSWEVAQTSLAENGLHLDNTTTISTSKKHNQSKPFFQSATSLNHQTRSQSIWKTTSASSPETDPRT